MATKEPGEGSQTYKYPWFASEFKPGQGPRVSMFPRAYAWSSRWVLAISWLRSRDLGFTAPFRKENRVACTMVCVGFMGRNNDNDQGLIGENCCKSGCAPQLIMFG